MNKEGIKVLLLIYYLICVGITGYGQVRNDVEKKLFLVQLTDDILNEGVVFEKGKNVLEVTKKESVIDVFLVISILLSGILLFTYIKYRHVRKKNVLLQEENKTLIEQRIEAEKLTDTKSQFISTVSHELRTPLYGVVGITTLLLEEKDISGKHKKLLDSLKFSGDYLLDLINKVLKISKIESNNEKLTKTSTNLFELTKNLFYSFEYQAKNKNNELVLEIPDELPRVLHVDSLKLSEVLINLIGNSSKFTENGKIWLRIKIISLEKEMITIRYEVEDNGVGIPEDKKEFVFQKFSQVGREFNKSEGTGLGLSIVKNLLEMMDSKINLDSKEGRGTKFYFDLKLEIINEKTVQKIDCDHKSVHPVYRKILVAEDNKINQIVTKNLLNIIGYDCTIVENGFNALQMVKKEDFDLILMDLNMPYLNGTEATRRIREFNQTTPIIALTASELSEVGKECFDIGMNDVINKPLNKNDLKNIISKHLSYNI
ncbi:response regulator [Aquimarina aquimarini]|uniref:response regulator n=1 Tax=Aquimarina aquimarini TaxID=1191734 RepID=UPI000D55C0A9|nr:response regulator [Aquimarina aquimarini]